MENGNTQVKYKYTKITSEKAVYLVTSYLDLLTGRSALSVILKLLFDKPHAEPESQKHGPVSWRPTAKPSPKAGGL